MIGEIDLFGVFLPPLLVWLGLGLLLSAAMRWSLSRIGLYRYVWHRPLFDLALLVILTGAVSYAAQRLF
ncbi:DUF1656 domain-containing protein [Acidocella sp.]|jgi:hypothetical protein|uniref:DUF1656 domain-containing protein n=1 Tax=Acidocella sp. TaxID=50710 RepID=UPI002F3FC6D6